MIDFNTFFSGSMNTVDAVIRILFITPMFTFIQANANVINMNVYILCDGTRLSIH